MAMIRSVFDKRADPKRGTFRTYPVPCDFLRDTFRCHENHPYQLTDDFEPAYQKLVGFDLITAMPRRESYVYHGDPAAAHAPAEGSAFIAFTNFTEGAIPATRRYGMALLIGGTAYYKADFERERALFSIKGYFSPDMEEFHLHNLQIPDFNGTDHKGLSQMMAFSDYNVMTAFAFAKRMTQQIFETGETPALPSTIWYEEANQYYKASNPLWRTP